MMAPEVAATYKGDAAPVVSPVGVDDALVSVGLMPGVGPDGYGPTKDLVVYYSSMIYLLFLGWTSKGSLVA